MKRWAGTLSVRRAICAVTVVLMAACGGGGSGGGDSDSVSRFVDNGDGTSTDNDTGLMWEKKDDNNPDAFAGEGVHDRNNTYTWTQNVAPWTAYNGTVVSVFLDRLNNRCDDDETTACTTNADCVGAPNTYANNHLCGHAGHRDWRLPSINELEHIVDYGRYNPAVDPMFNATCASGCTVTSSPGPECSCTMSYYYWSSTTSADIDAYGMSFAWSVDFSDGSVDVYAKDNFFPARAVRGGL